MKIWLKYLLGITIGIILGIFIPPGNIIFEDTLKFLNELIINIGRYTIFPIVFFSIGYGTFKLKQEKRISSIYLKTIAYIITSSTLLVLIATGIVLLFSPDRIPIIIENQISYNFPGYKNIFTSIFPMSLFQIFTENSNYLLPVTFLGFLLGYNFSFDKVMTRPAYQFFDAMSRIFYHIGSFIVEILGFGMIILAANFTIQIIHTPQLVLFNQLIILLTINTTLVIFGIYPVIIYFLGGKQNPYKIIYAILGPSLAAAASGNSYFTLTSLIYHVKENLGVPRKIGSATLPVFTLFGKAGTAAATSITFFLILKSYSSLSIGPVGILWIMLFSILSSFLAGTVPGIGILVSLAAMCKLYGKGIEEGFLIIGSIAPILISFSVLIDTITAGVSTYLISHHEKGNKEISIKDFV
ncbi:MAG: dicarboxylate/amino acid:cation symporter [Spirochaetales bacterium]|nr:dicarboxylate/amino acid:cation symporter [Spirochaetales bacterium]